MSNVDVTADNSSGAVIHRYSYDDSGYQIQAVYHPDSQLAEEDITVQDQPTSEVLLSWRGCSVDPWTFPPGQMPQCTLFKISPDQDVTNLDFDNEPIPFSAQLLSDQDRHVLDAQLQDALKALPSLATQIRPTPRASTCAACVIAGELTPTPAPIPVLPDFSVTRISGPTQLGQGLSATYEVVLANLGAKSSSQVQIQIQVSGSLRYLQMVQTPTSFACTGTGPITCTGPLGGNGDPPATTVANFQIQAQGAQAGLGSISAYANPSGAIQESNPNNNAQTLAVTVN
jgi:CARDB